MSGAERRVRANERSQGPIPATKPSNSPALVSTPVPKSTVLKK